MQKVALFPFNGEMMCFIHVLLNTLDMHEKGLEVIVVVEGAATRLLPELARQDNPMHSLYQKVRDKGLLAGACKACSAKMGVLESVRADGVPLLDDMNGHPGMAGLMLQGYAIVTF
jgi:hypothetical protein